MKTIARDLGKGGRSGLLYSETSGHLFLQKAKIVGNDRWVTLLEKNILKEPSLLFDCFQVRGLFGEHRAPILIQDATDAIVPLIAELLETAGFQQSGLPILVLAASYLKPSSKLRLFFEKHPTFFSVGCFHPTTQELTHYVATLMANLQLTAEREVMAHLGHMYRDEPALLAQEIGKCAAYIFPETFVKMADIHAIVTPRDPLEEKAVEFFLKRDAKALTAFLTRVMKEGRQPISILRFFQTVLLKQAHLVSLRQQGLSWQEAARQMTPPLSPFQLRDIEGSLSGWTKDQLARTLHLLVEAEKKAKLASYQAEIGVIRALLSSMKR